MYKNILCPVVVFFMSVALVYAGKYQEAPMLKRLVDQGKLPPVEERLPDNPWVVGSGAIISAEWLDFKVGKYSDGKLAITADVAPRSYQIAIGATNFLIAPDQSTSPDKVKGALAEWVKWNDDFSVYTIKIRPGLRWSDGAPVSTEDVRFLSKAGDRRESPRLHPAPGGEGTAGAYGDAGGIKRRCRASSQRCRQLYYGAESAGRWGLDCLVIRLGIVA